MQISIERGAEPDANFVFMSTDSQGTPGQLNRYVHERLSLGSVALPGPETLAPGYAFKRAGSKTLVYIVTINRRPVIENLRRNLSAALTELSFEAGARFWIPLMGTGAGGLPALSSLVAILDALGSVSQLRTAQVVVVISVPATMPSSDYEALKDFYRERTRIARSTAEASEPPPYPGGMGMKYGPDVWALMQVATALSLNRRAPGTLLTTTLLMFALTQASRPGVPADFAQSSAARSFGEALKRLAGPAFDTQWISYFGHEDVGNLRLDPPSAAENLSDNCSAWFANAASVASRAGRVQVTIDDLIAMFGQPESSKVRPVLAAMNVSLNDLLAEYRRLAVAPMSSKDSATILEFLVHDQASSQDELDFNQYAIAITNFLMGPDTKGPISISVQAPWGAGKSSLMQQVRLILDTNATKGREVGHAKILDVLNFLNRKHTTDDGAQGASPAKPELWTVWFNAWKYETSEQVWAGLVDAIISQVSDRISPVERELFLLRLNLARIDDGEVRKKIYDRVATYGWAGVRWISAVVAALSSGLLALGGGGPAVLATLSAGGLAVLVWFVRAWIKVRNEPAKFSLAEYVRVPDYAKSVGITHQIHRDLQRVIGVLPKRQCANGVTMNQPLVIFVDDLDRCSPSKVASVVEGINTFLAGDQPEFFFVIGMDPQMVAAALEHAHKEVKNYLPSYEKTVPLGWRFMDKFIQLAFTIPPRRGPAIDVFVSSLTNPARNVTTKPSNPAAAMPVRRSEIESTIGRGTVGAGSGAPLVEPAEAQRLQQAVSKTVTNESEDVREMMAGITKQMPCSPREIKRILNFVRFVLLLRLGRFTRNERVPALPMYERWIILCMRWPDMMRWLQWGADRLPPAENFPTLEGVAAQRLSILERAAFEPGDELHNWGRSAAQSTGLVHGEVSWLADPDLHRFFMNEARRPPEERLSYGASIGFY